MAGPFTGHAGAVWSVEFSPDGQHIVSGSHDRTIRVWDSMTGKTALAESFTERTDAVWSVAFSPDGQHILSGSEDRAAIRAMTGEMPFTGHTNWISFSPDG